MITRTVRSTMLASAAASLLMVFGSTAFAAHNAATIAEHLNKEKYTKSEIKSYVKDLKGQQVTANGTINDIESGKRGYKVVVGVKVPGRGRDFVVDVLMDEASNLRKNESVSCTGEFVRYNPFNLNGITLKDGKCSKR